MSYPTFRDWLFSFKTFAAAMLALYLGLALELPRPYWAMATVYIVSNPFVGATRSKALYRALGTMLGAAAAVVIVPPFVEMPYLCSLLIALWTGTLLYLAISERTARSYVFMLAGYTLPLIALPAVTDPTAVFDLAVARTEEILLGIVCASVVGGALWPSRLAPGIVERTDAWFRDAVFYARETLSGHMAGKALSECRLRLAATVNGLEFLLSQLAYDHTRPDILARAQALRGRMQLLLPVMSALGDPLVALLDGARARPAGLQALIDDTARWFDTPLDDEPAAPADALRARIAALEPGVSSLVSWDDALLSNALWRLRQLVDVWQDCRTLRLIIAREKGGWRPRYRHWRLGGQERHVDRGMLLLSAGSAVGAIFVASSLWILSGWQDGAPAVTLAAVACCFFAALDEPAPQVFAFFVWTCVSVVLAGLYLFLILPIVHDFPMLVIMFAAPFLLVGTLIPRPRFSLATMLVAVNTATFISIQSAYDANVLTFLNSNLAGIAGLLFAFIWTRATRPFGAEFAAARLLRSSWADVVLSASTRPIDDQRNLAARMLDRLMQLIPRLAATDDDRHPSVESFRDLRVAFNALDLRRLRRKLGGDVPAALDRVLEGVRLHFENCIARRTRQPVPPSLAAAIAAAVERVAQQRAANPVAQLAADAHPEAGFTTDIAGNIAAGIAADVAADIAGEAAPRPASPAVDGAAMIPRSNSARRLRDALHALVGLHLSLFPGAPDPARSWT